MKQQFPAPMSFFMHSGNDLADDVVGVFLCVAGNDVVVDHIVGGALARALVEWNAVVVELGVDAVGHRRALLLRGVADEPVLLFEADDLEAALGRRFFTAGPEREPSPEAEREPEGQGGEGGTGRTGSVQRRHGGNLPSPCNT